MSSNKGKYFEVGETFKEKEINLKVAESQVECKGCHYHGTLCYKNAPKCGKLDRQDLKNVIFIRNE